MGAAADTAAEQPAETRRGSGQHEETGVCVTRPPPCAPSHPIELCYAVLAWPAGPVVTTLQQLSTIVEEEI